MKRRQRHAIVGSVLATMLAFDCGTLAALELGSARLKSAPGAPLDIEIALLDVEEGELDSLQPVLPPNSRSPELASATVELDRSAAGAPLLRVRTSTPVTAAELRFVVVADWGRGRKFREYLLGSASPAAPETTPAATETATEGVSRTVRPGETLMSISREWSARTGTSLAQSMLGIYRDNPQAFGPRGMSELLVGAELRLPSADRLNSTSVGAASNEVGRALGIWRTAGSEASTAAVSPAATTVAPAPAPAPATGAVAPPQASEPPETPEARAARLEAEIAALEARLAAAQSAAAAPAAAAQRTDLAADVARSAGWMGEARRWAAEAWWAMPLLAVLSLVLLIALLRARRVRSDVGPETASNADDNAAREMTLELPPVKPTRAEPEAMPDVLMGEPARTAAPKTATPRAVTPLVAAPTPTPTPTSSPAPASAPSPLEDLEGDPPPIDEAGSKIDLARAFIEMGHHDAAILELQAALRLGDETQRAEAIRLLDSLPKS